MHCNLRTLIVRVTHACIAVFGPPWTFRNFRTLYERCTVFHRLTLLKGPGGSGIEQYTVEVVQGGHG